MPFEIMSSSFFSEEIRFPAEKQVRFWKPESVPDHSERNSSPSMTSWRAGEQDFGLRSNLYAQPTSLFVEGNTFGLNGTHYENGLFSSSLSESLDKKLRLSTNNVPLGQSVDTFNSNSGDDEPFESLEEIEAQTIGNLLPDDDDLLSGVIDDFGYVARLNSGDDGDDDIFFTGGGLELEADDGLNRDKISDFVGGESSDDQQGGLNSQFGGEHPYGEHPSRTLFVRNINSNVEDTELRALFEQYGDIRALYTACKHRGFVMISYYDIRAARSAMRALQNKPLRRRKLDIHFSIPKDKPSEEDINQGTLVVFNLDTSVSNDDICQIFGVYGEIKEIRETPHKHHHKFIEFYDVRAAEAALRALNRSDIAGKKIKLEPSRPGGARRCIMQQLFPELEEEESTGCWHGSPPSSSPSGFYESIPTGAITSNGLDHGLVQGLHSAARPPASPFMETTLDGTSSSGPQSLSSPIRVASVGSHGNPSGPGELSHSLGQMKFGLQCVPTFHPQSVPEYHDGMIHGIPYNPSGTMSAMCINSRPAEGIESRHIHNVGSGSFNSRSFESSEGAFGVSGNGSCPLHGHQYIWNAANGYRHHAPPGPMTWSTSAPFMNSISAHYPPRIHGFPGAPSHLLNTVLPLPHHRVGSAPAMNPSLWSRRQPYGGDTTDARAFHPGSVGSMGISGNSLMHPLELASHNIFPRANGNCIDPAQVLITSPQQRCHLFQGRNPMIPPASFDTPNDRIRSRRGDASVNQADNKRQFELDIGRIICGEDSRTTLMIKNIPNKYTSKMLLAAIDEHNRGTYDFIYLPIDFKNKCNVGYAFINMTTPQQIIPFYQAFNGKKWEKFNSEKVASLAYARIQGKTALIAHFQNSSLMNEDKRCRPILFHSDGPNAGDQEPFPMGVNIRSRPGRPRTWGNEEDHQGSPSISLNGDENSNGTDSSLGSAKVSEDLSQLNSLCRGTLTV